MKNKAIKIIIVIVFLLSMGGNILMAELLLPSDTLAQGYPKINTLINEFNHAVVEGDSSLEAALAHVAENGTVFPSLKARLDDSDAEMSSKATKSELSITNTNIANNTTIIASVASGSPKGVYATVPLLTAAYPTGNTNIYVVTGDIKEVDTLTVNTIPTVASNATITLNGVAVNVALTLAMTTTTLVATAIRNTSFTGWTTGGAGAVVTFTKTTSGTNTAPTFSAGTTGSTASFAVTTPGVALDGKWYYWNSSAWTSGGTYQSTGIADKSITQGKLSFAAISGVPSKNLFDKATVTTGYYADFSSGLLGPNANYSTSDYIPISPSSQYVKTDNMQLAFYDSGKVYISGITTGSAAITFTTPSNAKYIRFGVLNTMLSSYQLEPGGVSTVYEAYGAKVSKETIGFPALEGVKSKNLFNKTTVSVGKYVTHDTGELGVSAGYNASDYITILPSTNYVKRTNQRFAYYDSNKVFISGVLQSNLLTAPVNAAYVRITVLNADLNTEQLELGTEATTYESYTYKLSPDNIPSSLRQIYKNCIIVAKSGGQYTTVSEAVEEAPDSIDNPVTILLMPGTYEESVDIRGRYISLVGLNRETCIIINYLADYAQPPINISGSNNHIDNITAISAKDGTTPIQLGSYGIHCDSVGQGAGVSTIKNSKIECVQNAAIGLGTTDHQTVIIDNCELISHETYSLYAHNYQLSGATEQKLIVKNSRIATKAAYAAIMIQDANNRVGGNADDERDTVFSFYNNIAWSEVSGKTGMLGGDAALDANSWRGYIKLGADSFGNNITEINAQ